MYKRCYPNAMERTPPAYPVSSAPIRVRNAAGLSSRAGRWPVVTPHMPWGLVDMRDPVDIEIFADKIDAKVSARAFNCDYLSGARSAVVERDPRGWVVRVYQYAPVGYLAPKTGAAA